ncbi:MAG: UPF0147 family protein [Candidatus Freyarchaeota archaeon]|nr:UPF0147 family protein [Candidatus Freyrarchaeum guaymaensis]
MSDAAEKMEQAIAILKQISEDNATPRNIRRAANEAIEALKEDKYTPAVKASNAISILEEVSQDPNCPLHSRTKIWNAVSILETVRDE